MTKTVAKFKKNGYNGEEGLVKIVKEEIKKEYKELFDTTTKNISIVEVPAFQFVMIDGVGNPRVDEFHDKSKLLHLFAKEVKKYYKELGRDDYMSSPLEALWDTYDNSKFDVDRKELIKYTLMMVQPPLMNNELFELIKKRLTDKHNHAYIEDIYLKTFKEGKSVQLLHVGAYDTEITSTKQIMEYITVQGYKLNGMHHEIYLNDPQKVEPNKLKTIIRYSII